MANVITDKVWRVDTAAVVTANPVRVTAVTYVFSGASGVALFQETDGGATVFRFTSPAGATDTTYHVFFGSDGVEFDGIFAKTLTNVTEVLIYTK